MKGDEGDPGPDYFGLIHIAWQGKMLEGKI
jgi:hypothetical protein